MESGRGRTMLTLLIIELGIVIVVAAVLGADMAAHGHPYLRDGGDRA